MSLRNLVTYFRHGRGASNRHGRIRRINLIRRIVRQTVLHFRNHRTKFQLDLCAAVFLITKRRQLHQRLTLQINILVIIQTHTKITVFPHRQIISGAKRHTFISFQFLVVTIYARITVALQHFQRTVTGFTEQENARCRCKSHCNYDCCKDNQSRFFLFYRCRRLCLHRNVL